MVLCELKEKIIQKLDIFSEKAVTQNDKKNWTNKFPLYVYVL